MHNKQIPPPNFCAFCTKISNSTIWERWHGITEGVWNQCFALYVIPCRVDSIPFARITFTPCVITYKRKRLIYSNSPCAFCTKISNSTVWERWCGMRNSECGMRIRAKASIKAPSVKMLFDFHKLRSSLFERTASLGSSMWFLFKKNTLNAWLSVFSLYCFEEFLEKFCQDFMSCIVWMKSVGGAISSKIVICYWHFVVCEKVEDWD